MLSVFATLRSWKLTTGFGVVTMNKPAPGTPGGRASGEGARVREESGGVGRGWGCRWIVLFFIRRELILSETQWGAIMDRGHYTNDDMTAAYHYYLSPKRPKPFRPPSVIVEAYVEYDCSPSDFTEMIFEIPCQNLSSVER